MFSAKTSRDVVYSMQLLDRGTTTLTSLLVLAENIYSSFTLQYCDYAVSSPTVGIHLSTRCPL